MQESQQNLITIIDIRPEVVQVVLRFIYTDEVIGVAKMAHELLAAAFICENIKTMQGTDWKGLCSSHPDLIADIFNKLSVK